MYCQQTPVTLDQESPEPDDLIMTGILLTTTPCAFHWTLSTNDITSYLPSRLGVWMVRSSIFDDSGTFGPWNCLHSERKLLFFLMAQSALITTASFFFVFVPLNLTMCLFLLCTEMLLWAQTNANQVSTSFSTIKVVPKAYYTKKKVLCTNILYLRYKQLVSVLANVQQCTSRYNCVLCRCCLTVIFLQLKAKKTHPWEYYLCDKRLYLRFSV